MPPRRTGAVAQLGERCNRTAEVRGSTPLGSTSLRGLRPLRLGKPVRSEGCRAEVAQQRRRATQTKFISYSSSPGSNPSRTCPTWAFLDSELGQARVLLRSSNHERESGPHVVTGCPAFAGHDDLSNPSFGRRFRKIDHRGKVVEALLGLLAFGVDDAIGLGIKRFAAFQD
jgi:hypothetical protein